ncbi:hypothetical protein QN379_14505 [Glaciimonas sp. Gout2]|uniref:hypothetical protein n=1 Tax=unclassified Glaciimonas TaxID=2644401 RepID=UPI002AB40770|nr:MULTISPECIES: hypothetical protein [unclassified Glaciimonas]MDY7547403.1 hypothetical protein [Glaciimonas sp. CA11.2]MEB0013582.1 hypothetical protein [Glaciimonas sp. Cout2]MEB0083217.1 hypothetical protein [Glaciimonas sp. Gout2]
MKTKIFSSALTLSLVCSGTVWGATVLPQLKQANTQVCIQMGASAQGTPKNKTKLPTFCDCVSNTYWNSVPQAEYDSLIKTGKSPLLEASMEKRLNVAKASCLKKNG